MIQPSLDGYTPEDVQRIASRYFNDVGNEAKRRELQHVADLAAQQQRQTDEQNETVPTNKLMADYKQTERLQMETTNTNTTT